MRFLNEGRIGFALTNLSFIGVGLFLQLLTAFIVHRKRGMKVLVYEWFIVLSMLKPAIDAKRIADGNIQRENTLFDPQL